MLTSRWLLHLCYADHSFCNSHEILGDNDHGVILQDLLGSACADPSFYDLREHFICHDPFCRIFWALLVLILVFRIFVKFLSCNDPLCKIFWALVMLILVFTICMKFRLRNDPFCRIFWALPHQPRWRKAWPCTQSRWPLLTAIRFRIESMKSKRARNTTYHIIWFHN